jgi:cysteine synthase A
MNGVAASIVDVIGNTPAVELSRLTRGLEGRIVAKLEYLNPGFSKKDRIARQIVDEAIASGELQPGQTVVELTSGNTGTGLAIVCAIRGHPFVAVISEGNSPERARMMRALGAEVVLVPQAEGSLPDQVSGADLALTNSTPAPSSGPRRADASTRSASSSALVGPTPASHSRSRLAGPRSPATSSNRRVRRSSRASQ